MHHKNLAIGDHCVLISKDACGKFYLPPYGNKHWKTPNLNELAQKGTVFSRHYTAAPSSAMAYNSMFTGKYPYESDNKYFLPVDKNIHCDSIFDLLEGVGYTCHIIWDRTWMNGAQRFSNCYGGKTIFHNLNEFQQQVGPHIAHNDVLIRSKVKTEESISMFEKELISILDNGRKLFLWIHFPHVINGRIGYGDDIDVYDHLIGVVRKYFSDNDIVITSDHGNMNGQKGKLCYGFDVYEPAISIPLIMPRIRGVTEYNDLTTNVDLHNLLLYRKIKQRAYIVSESAYYAQPNRKIAIILGNYKLIYNKAARIFELYDLDYDPSESVNLYCEKQYDTDRKVMSRINELYYYPYWHEANTAKKELLHIFHCIYKNGTITEEIMGFAQEKGRILYKTAKVHYKKLKQR